MSNPYQPKVQQKLSHCQILLAMLQDNPSLGPQHKEALLQAAALHLAVALRLYLRELASFCELKQPEQIYTLADLQEKLGPNSPFNDLQRYSWLNALFGIERQILSPPVDNDKPVLIAQGTGLVSQNIPHSLESIVDWVTQFQEFSERHRASFVEY